MMLCYRKISILLSVLIMLFRATPGLAAVQTWTGGAGTMDFNDPANWSGAGPQSGDYMKFGAGGVYQATNVIYITASCQVSGIILQRGTMLSVTISDGVTVTIDNTDFAFDAITVPFGETVSYSVINAGSGSMVGLGHIGIANHGMGGLTIGTSLVIGGGYDIRILGSESVILSGAISGLGSLGVQMDTTEDIVTLFATCTHTGSTFVGCGTLRLMNAGGTNHLSASGSGILEICASIDAADWDHSMILRDGTLKVSAAGTVIDREIGISGTCHITGSESITISGNIYEEIISPNAAVTVNMDAPDDVVRLTGPNDYSGATTINGGTLSWEGVNAKPSPVTVNNAGSTLSGTGTLPDAVTMNNATKLAPGLNGGADVGTLTINGLLTFNNESIYEVTVTGGAADRIIAGNNVIAAGGAPNVEFQPGYSTTGLALPAAIMQIAGTYTAFDESALPAGWDIDDAPSGGLIRLTSLGAISPVTIPVYDEWGMFIAFLLLSGRGIMHIRKRVPMRHTPPEQHEPYRYKD